MSGNKERLVVLPRCPCRPRPMFNGYYLVDGQHRIVVYLVADRYQEIFFELTGKELGRIIVSSPMINFSVSSIRNVVDAVECMACGRKIASSEELEQIWSFVELYWKERTTFS